VYRQIQNNLSVCKTADTHVTHTRKHTQKHLLCGFSWQHIRLQQTEMQCSESTTFGEAAGFKETIWDRYARAALLLQGVQGLNARRCCSLLTRASLPHCNTQSVIRYNKGGNEVRQQGETPGKATKKATAVPYQHQHTEDNVLYSSKWCQSSRAHMETEKKIK